jgi:carboxymethylenebutenolidase
MARTAVRIPTPDGQADGTLHTPDGTGPWPGVVMFPDAGGARATFAGMGDHLASLGFVTLVPDVYYRSVPWQPFDLATAFTDEAERKRLFEQMGTLTRERIIADAGAYLEFLLARDEVSGRTAGTTGYCMGGRMSMIAAGEQPDLVGAAASFHGGRIALPDDPNSPHLAAPRIKATVYVAGAQDDESYTEDHAKLLEAALTEAGVAHTLEIYPAHHGFAVPDNPTHDAAAEARHWDALVELYGSALARP